MNTIGKTLVVLNFVFAIIIGVFLVLLFSIQTQWKAAYHDKEREIQIMQASRNATKGATDSVLNDNKALSAKIDTLNQSIYDEKGRRDALQIEHDVKIADLTLKLDDAALTTKEAKATVKRLTDEVGVLDKAISERQAQIAKLEGDVKKYLVEAIGNQARARTLQIQNEGLLEQLRDVTGELARLKSGVSSDSIAIRNPNEPNPPAVLVNGKIERIDPVDGTLIQISIGSDHGVNKNHTLDVYRTVPEPKYLGMIRIVESYQQKSVARLVAANAAMRNQLRADDIVTSKITK